MRRTFVIFALIMAFIPTGICAAKDTIHWPYFSMPPLFIVDRNQPGGFGIDIQKMLAEQMPEYNHKLVLAAPARMFAGLREGKNYVLIGVAKTPDREKFMQYSLPCRVAFTDMVVIRKQDAEKLGAGRDISLERLASDSSLSFGHLRDASYGAEIDKILEKNKDALKTVNTSGPNAMEQMIRMILAGRVDWTLNSPSTVNMFMKMHDGEGKLMVLPVREVTRPAVLGFMAAPKNEWGIRVISKIDAILAKEIKAGRMIHFQKQWMPENLRPKFEEMYREMILKPALEK